MNQNLARKHIVLAVTGSISAYKSAELLRELKKLGAEVRVVMSTAATQFITPLTMQTLSEHSVYTELLEHDTAMAHIELARWADLVLIAPASANTIASLVQGMAHNLITAICLATRAAIMIAPAMNQNMWSNPITQDNIAKLTSHGITMLETDYGEQACGDVGHGRMLANDKITQAVMLSFTDHLLADTKIMITAGPTREYIDPIRFISNRSSGRMGYAIADAAVKAGAKVTLISGPVTLSNLPKVTLLPVISAQDMYHAVMSEIDGIDIFISVAAVADYTYQHTSLQKIKKKNDTMVLNLTKTTDILATVANIKPKPFTIGFAAETTQVDKYAKIKLKEKKLDMVVANQVGDGIGMEVEDNALSIYWENGYMKLQKAQKLTLANQLINLIADCYHEKKHVLQPSINNNIYFN